MTCVLCGEGPAVAVLSGTDHREGLGGDFRVVRCSGCGLHRTDPWPDDLAAWYPETYQPHAAPTLTARVVGAAIRRACRTRTRLGRRILGDLVPDADLGGPVSRGERVLDVGAGSGMAVASLRAAGIDAHGVEPTARAVETGRARGVATLIEGTLEDAAAPGGPLAGTRWSVIRVYHVLEHVPDPVATLRLARTLLAPGGRVVVCVPNIAGVLSSATGPAWAGLELPRHLHHFDAATLGSTIRAAGLRADAVRTVAVFGVLPASLDARTAGGRRRRGWGASLPLRALAYPLEIGAAALGRGDALLAVARASDRPGSAPATASSR